jgi:hypothetical protein
MGKGMGLEADLLCCVMCCTCFAPAFFSLVGADELVALMLSFQRLADWD